MVANLHFDLLQRLVVIQKSITGVVDAVPRLFDPASAAGPYIRFANGLQRSNIQRDGTGYRRETATVTMRAVLGAYGSGYVGEREDIANTFYDSVLDTFWARLALQHPSNNEPLRYLDSLGATIGDVIYARALEYSPGTLLLCADFILTVNLYYPFSRVVYS